MKELLEKLTQTFGPSGYESEIRDLIAAEVKPYADEVTIDPLGNLIVRKGRKKKSGKRIMISSHMDEVGLMASHIDEHGFIYFAFIGGVSPLTCVSSRVRFQNGIEGVISVESEKIDNGKIPTVENLFVDVGANSRETCPVHPGDVAVFERPFLDLGERWVSKTLDDRVGCAIAIETLKMLKETPNEIYFVFSVQEEVGCRGALTAAYTIDPDIGIAIDVTVASDTPFGEKANPVLGNGPCIKVLDGMLVANPAIVSKMEDAATKAGVTFQMEVLRFAGTDAGNIQFARAGVPSGCLSISCRYVHSSSEMVQRSDCEQSVKLLCQFLND